MQCSSPWTCRDHKAMDPDKPFKKLDPSEVHADWPSGPASKKREVCGAIREVRCLQQPDHKGPHDDHPEDVRISASLSQLILTAMEIHASTNQCSECGELSAKLREAMGSKKI